MVFILEPLEMDQLVLRDVCASYCDWHCSAHCVLCDGKVVPIR